MTRIVTIFGSSTPQPGSRDYDAAYECGKLLAEAGFTICNGGYGGTMEAAAKGARSSGGTTIGVTVADWPRKANEWIQEEIRAADLAERIQRLIGLGNAYVVLRGGTGTLLELAYVLELINKDIIPRKPIVLLGDTWNGVMESLRQEPVSGRQKDVTELVHTVQSPSDVAAYLRKTLLPRP
ncbi:MAG TPA: LOG family protein [Bacteroidota bacterium]|nr:LOG family protein [Bacteroidota bacterium]